ncbi:hypothetical protein MFLAVUS_006113 [Mucor flavus]|uniref:Uncharacterized protein n=1 Tax=Mucor flavus TaxID=439312 RepID=A0ABP9Z0M9_9FUNG
MIARAAAIKHNIEPRIAQIWVKKDQDVPQPYFERKEGSGGPVGRPPKLGDEREKFLVELADEQPSSVLNQIMNKARLNWMTKRNETDMDYMSNCVFIDEAAFHINMKRSFTWSKVGTRAVIKTPKTRARTTTILEAICPAGAVNITVRQPKTQTASKEEKLPEEVARQRKKVPGQLLVTISTSSVVLRILWVGMSKDDWEEEDDWEDEEDEEDETSKARKKRNKNKKPRDYLSGRPTKDQAMKDPIKIANKEPKVTKKAVSDLVFDNESYNEIMAESLMRVLQELINPHQRRVLEDEFATKYVESVLGPFLKENKNNLRNRDESKGSKARREGEGLKSNLWLKAVYSFEKKKLIRLLMLIKAKIIQSKQPSKLCDTYSVEKRSSFSYTPVFTSRSSSGVILSSGMMKQALLTPDNKIAIRKVYINLNDADLPPAFHKSLKRKSGLTKLDGATEDEIYNT